VKKVIFLMGFLLLVSAGILAQASGYEQRLVGIWTNQLDTRSSLTFNANGTMAGTVGTFGFVTPTRQEGQFVPTHWAAAGNQIVLFTPGGHRVLREFQISSDGRTLIIINHMQISGMGFGSFATPFQRN